MHAWDLSGTVRKSRNRRAEVKAIFIVRILQRNKKCFVFRWEIRMVKLIYTNRIILYLSLFGEIGRCRCSKFWRNRKKQDTTI